jgi:CubicO group peptidase (beta-lactamase class C family)
MKKLSKAAFWLSLLLCFLSPSTLAEEEALKEAIDSLELSIVEGMKETGTPGLSVAVVHKGKVVYSEGFGVRRLGESAPVTPQTVFQIGSISKSFTAFLVGHLVDKGAVDWNDRVIDHLPGFRLADPWVTREFRVFDLMSQHSGLPATAGDLQILSDIDRNHIVETLRYIQPASSFRSEFAYQNGLFLAAAQLLEKKTGVSWEQLLQDTAFAPLGMTHSSSRYSDYLQEPNRAGFHQAQNGKVVALPNDWPFFDYVDLLGPAGSVNSNAEDMARYLIFRLTEENNKLLSAQTARFLQRPQTVVTTGLYYCQGLMYKESKNGAVIWHNGETSGARNMMAFSPQHQLGIIILSNLRGNRLPDWLALNFLSTYEGHPLTATPFDLESDHVSPKPTSPAAPRELSEYAGQFESPVYGVIQVAAMSDRLAVTFSGSTQAFSLAPWDGDTFWLTLPIIDQPASGLCRFTFDEAGVSSVTLEAFDAGGIGTFVRKR